MSRPALLIVLALVAAPASAQTPETEERTPPRTSRSPGLDVFLGGAPEERDPAPEAAEPGDAAPAARSVAAGDDAAAPEGPVLEASIDAGETLPGRPVTLRLTVLVPSFLPDPPVWPSLDAPDLLVHLPERAGGPVSRRIGGETWSGVARVWRLYPLAPGLVTIPPQEIRVAYAGDDGETLTATLRAEAVSLTASIPAGAEDLDPFVAAEALALDQSVEGAPSAMTPGDSVARTVTARIDGAPPMLLPALLALEPMTGVAAYADEPALEQTEERGVLSGSRTERVTYVAEGGGGGVVPPVEIRWWNVAENRVETARAEGFAIAVDGPPARSAEPRDWRRMALLGTVGLLGLGSVFWLARRLGPPLARWAAARRAERRRSEAHAWRRLRRVVGRRDHAALRPALDAWAAASPGPDPRLHRALSAALTDLGRARYGSGGDPEQAWRAVTAALPAARRAALRGHAGAPALPPLNPAQPSRERAAP